MEVDLAVRVWNVLGGMDWAGLEAAAEMHGVNDIDILIRQLTVIRGFRRE